MYLDTSSGREKVALWWSHEPEGVRCHLCPHMCLMKNGEAGKCRVRVNVNGILITENYGRVCVQALDTVEKKPLYHYKPGARLLSLGTFGCNMSCLNCQNFVLSQSSRDQVDCGFLTAQKVLDYSLASGVDGIAFTFNEPVVWLEFVMEVARLAHQKGIFLVINTNGYISRWALDDLLPWVDAFNIDVKGFSNSFYQSNCGGRLDSVLDTCVRVAASGVHMELTYLLIPGLNDSLEELSGFFEWVVKELGARTPVHLFRFLPSHLLSHLPPTSLERMEEAYRAASSLGLMFVYFGGVTGHVHQNTYCPRCGTMVIRRRSERTRQRVFLKAEELSRFCPSYPEVELKLEKGRCPVCGERIPMSF